MLTAAPSVAAEILLLEKRPEEISIIQEASDANRLSVVPECPDLISFLRREGEYSNAPRPDLILLDLDLSVAADCEMLTDLKKDPRFKRIPVVVLASSDKYEDVLQAYDLHANAYICKPKEKDELIQVVRSTLHFWLTLVRLPKE